ncbi:MAG: 4Fe-4S dicluster domain-containing protein [Terriglobales bacterium]
MPFWTLIGLQNGAATTRWPARGGDDGQSGSLGMPALHPERCLENCDKCAAVCLPGAITLQAAGAATRLELDYGRCVACQLCVEACPAGALTSGGGWVLGARRREDLLWSQALASPPAAALKDGIRRHFRRSLHIRHVDAGSCNGCESELEALHNPFYNLHRLGVFFTPSPRFADLLLVTGPVARAMRRPLLETYRAMPEPRWVMAMGACAISGGVAAGNGCGHGVAEFLPVDFYLPGCPPNPAAIIAGLLALLNRRAPALEGGPAGH